MTAPAPSKRRLIFLLAGLLALLALAAAVCSYFWLSSTSPKPPASQTPALSPSAAPAFIPLRIKNLSLQAELAVTPSQRVRGLSGRLSLPPARAMLFVFPSTDYHAFWMKDMNFPIDIVWIGENRRIVDIAANLAPETYPRLFRPRQPARYVLEMRAGTALQYSLKKGDRVFFSLPPSLPRPPQAFFGNSPKQ